MISLLVWTVGRIVWRNEELNPLVNWRLFPITISGLSHFPQTSQSILRCISPWMYPPRTIIYNTKKQGWIWIHSIDTNWTGNRWNDIQGKKWITCWRDSLSFAMESLFLFFFRFRFVPFRSSLIFFHIIAITSKRDTIVLSSIIQRRDKKINLIAEKEYFILIPYLYRLG